MYCNECGKSDPPELSPRARLIDETLSKMFGEPIYDAIRAERKRQDQKWGPQDHSPSHWFVILAEEIGEIAKAIYENDKEEYEKELVQSASVIVAALETFHRKGAGYTNLDGQNK